MLRERLFFDLDGTLTHPHEGITRCIQHALRSGGMEPPAASDLVRFVGPPLRDSFALLLATTDEARLDAAMAAYRTRYEATGIFENAVCPGIPEALEGLAVNGYHLSVVTAKPVVFARRVLDHFGLSRFFSGVYGPDLSTRGYTKGTLIRTALETTGFAPESVGMIGDRGEDIHGARANAVHAVAVTWGYGSDEELAAARPDRTVRSTVELLEYLQGAA
jgi:phosphoglycolate phosphatase